MDFLVEIEADIHRCHSYVLVNLSHVKHIRENEIKMTTGEILYICRRARQKAAKALENYHKEKGTCI
jgi:DNA-binding LytR/AlgR family response regulator